MSILNSTRVAVIGGGIIGLSTSLKLLLDNKECDVTVFSDKFTPNTTADVSAGCILPYACPGEKDLLNLWLLQTLDRLSLLHKCEDAFEIGIAPLSGYVFSSDIPDVMPNAFPDFHVLSKKECDMFLHIQGDGYHLTTYTCECSKYLPWLMKQIVKLGGRFVKKEISDFKEVGGYDVIINCTGIGAKKIINNEDMVADRGQVMVVKAPWIKQFIFADESYIIPRLTDVVLGGTHEIENYNLEVRDATAKQIFQRCCEVMPSLKYSQIVESKVGLRPKRTPPRLEVENIEINGHFVPVIHNYGHGGSGVTLHWGCAIQASKLLEKCISTKRVSKL